MSRNNESDEVFAKRLQNEEYQPKSELTPNLQQLQDEDFARQLAREEQTSTGTQFQLSSGQTAMIRLHHPATSLQIGEILLAHFITVDEMVFELAHVPGKYLKVKPSGNVEFSLGRDNEAFFKVGNSPSQSLYLMPKLFLNHWNSKNFRGWYLTMTRQGQLQGNGDRCQLAEWQLVSAAVQLNGLNSSHPPPIPQSAILQECNNPLLSDVASEGGRSQGSGGSGHPDSSRPASYFQAPSSGSAANAKILRGEVISSPPNAHHYGSAVTHQPSLPPMSPLSTSSSSAIAYNQHNSAPTSNHNNIGLSLDAPSFPGYGAGREALMKYFYTDEGFLFLQSVDNQDALRWFLQNGSLSQILHRPDWPIVARRFRHYATESVPALVVENIRSFQSPAQFPIFQQFFQAGYSIVRQEVSPAILQAANKVIQFWTHRYLQQPPPSFSSSFASSSSANVSQNQNGLLKTRYGGVYCVGDICQDVDILALYFESRLPQVTQYLLGSNDVLHPKHAQIRSSFPLLDFTVESPALYGDQWIIEGFTVHGEHSPYSLFLGIALTDISENDMGNLCVHPESHLLLMDLYKDHARYHRTAFSEDPQSSSRPNLGQPVEICLKAGDAIFCTQRLATLFTINNSFSTTTMVFFRISHVDHAQLKQAALESPWVEFPLASYYLDSPCNDETQHHGDISDSHKKGDEIVEVNATAISGSEQMTAVAAPIDAYSGRPIVAEALVDDPFAGLDSTSPIEWSSSPGYHSHNVFSQPIAIVDNHGSVSMGHPSGNNSIASSLDLLWTDVTPTTPFSPSAMNSNNVTAAPSVSSNVTHINDGFPVHGVPVGATHGKSPSSSSSMQRINPINHTIAFSPSQSTGALLFPPHSTQQSLPAVLEGNSSVASISESSSTTSTLVTRPSTASLLTASLSSRPNNS